MTNPETTRWNILFLAWLVSLVATLSALFIGEIMGKVPCELCWHQRIAMFPLVILLGVAVLRSDFSVWLYALPLSVAGWGVALFHTLLFFKIIPEELKPCSPEGPSCSGADMMIMGNIPLPLLSVITFTFIITLLTVLWRYKK